MSDNVESGDVRVSGGQQSPGRLRSFMHGLLTGFFGLAYAFVTWNAAFYLVQMAQLGISGYGWVVLLLPVIVPIIVFVIALALTRKRPLGAFIIVMLGGLGLSAVFWLNTLSYAIRNAESLLS
ncbi:hypothetical protein FM104_08215 [Microbacterium esteraromaticum]|uniref:Uncharacterized protein n=1 Tax=Microbacterium esteraromaticum TaxID=57043 RepID=A0A1R4JMI4_9MICO|nr:hypothetical protein [Microbacterium esteraromaticum]SJN33209.1 hypothetical protein FM104_08215 [Microbacterium esteraromaticum]